MTLYTANRFIIWNNKYSSIQQIITEHLPKTMGELNNDLALMELAV